MSPQQWVKGIRLFFGFLLAPAVVLISLEMSVDAVLAHLGAHPDGPAKIMIGAFLIFVGLAVPYLGALCFGLPYVIFLQGRGWLSFRTVMLPALVLSLVYAALVYLSLYDTFPHAHPLAGPVAILQMPAVILAALCFYFIGVWKSRRKPS